MRFVAEFKESFLATNRLGIPRLKAMININGSIHSRIHLLLKSIFHLLQRKDSLIN